MAGIDRQRCTGYGGICLGYNNSFFIHQSGAPTVLGSTGLCRYQLKEGEYYIENHTPIAQDDQVIISTARHPTHPYMAVFLQASQPMLILVNYNSGSIISQQQFDPGEISSMCFSQDGTVLLAAQRHPQRLLFFGLKENELILVNTVGNFLPQNAPFVPAYMIADPQVDGDFLVEIGMRGFRVHVQRLYATTMQEDAEQLRFLIEIIYMPCLDGATCARFARYKKSQFLLSGSAQSQVNVHVREKMEQKLVVEYPYTKTFTDVQLEQGTLNFADLLAETNIVYKSHQILNICNEISQDAQQPKHGICDLAVDGSSLLIGARGAMVLQYELVSQLRKTETTGPAEEVYENSEDEGAKIEQTIPEEDNDDLPRYQFKAAFNLAIEEYLNQQIGGNGLQTTIDYVTAQNDEQQQWSESRAQTEVLSLMYDGERAHCVVYDPITLQCVVVGFACSYKINYSVLHKCDLICQTYIAVFNLVYYQQMDQGVQELLAQVYQQIQQRQAGIEGTTMDGSALTGSVSGNAGRSVLSLLQVEAGGAAIRGSVASPLTASHVPNQLSTNKRQAIALRVLVSASVTQDGKFVLATREGLVYLLSDQPGRVELISSAKIFDAVLAVDLDTTGSVIVLSCTDSVRFFIQNGRFLSQTSEINVKMAQLVQVESSGKQVLAAANNKLHLIDLSTRRLALSYDAHNNPISSVCFADQRVVNTISNQLQHNRACFICTADNKGMVNVWKASQPDKSHGQFNVRAQIYKVQQYCPMKGMPVLALAYNGLVGLVDMNRSQFVYKFALQVENGDFTAVRDFVVVDLTRMQVVDHHGNLYLIYLPGDISSFFQALSSSDTESAATMQQLNYTTSVSVLPGKFLGHVSNQQKVEKFNQVLKVSGIDELGKFDVYEKPVQLVSNQQRGLLIATGWQPGAAVQCLSSFDGSYSDNQADSIQLDKNLLIALIKAKLNLQQRQVQATLDYEHQLKLLQQNNAQQLQQQQQNLQQQSKQLEDQIQEYINVSEKEAVALEEQLTQLDTRNAKELQDIENNFSNEVRKINLEKQQLEKQLENVYADDKEQVGQLNLQQQNAIDSLNNDTDQQLRNLTDQINKQLELKQLNQQKYKEMLDTADIDADLQWSEKQNEQRAQIEAMIDQIQTHNAEAGIIRNKFGALRKQIDQFISNQQQNTQTIQALQRQKEQLQGQREQTTQEKEQRKAIITESEQKIYELKQEVKEKEKHRFVLDFKIKELRKQIQPREQEINDLTEQTKEVGDELENYNKAIANLSNVIEGLKREENQFKNSLTRSRNEKQRAKQSLGTLNHDLAQIMEAHGQLTYVQLRDECERLYAFGGKDQIDAEKQLADAEKARHKEFLTAAARELSEQLQKVSDSSGQENQKIIEENTELLKEAAVLRREIQKIVHDPVSQGKSESQKVFQMRLIKQEAEIKALVKRLQELKEIQGEQ